MSIANEITRLRTAKQAIKTAIEKHSVSVPEGATLDVYGEVVDRMPFVIEGTFTPESNTNTFEVNGLPFSPKTIMCASLEVNQSRPPKTVVAVFLQKDSIGSLPYVTSEGVFTTANIGVNSSVVDWGEDSIKITVPSVAEIKQGYTYNFTISGGVE